MAYDKQTWVLGVQGGTPLNAVRLNYMEQGIEDAHTLIADLALNDHTHVSADISDATDASTPSTVVVRDAGGGFQAAYVSGLSTATGNTQAVPKSQLDAAIAEVSALEHTHTSDEISDASATGTSILTAVDVEAVRTLLDVQTSDGTNTLVDAAIAAYSTTVDADIATAVTTAGTNAEALVDSFLHIIVYDFVGETWGAQVRPSTTGTNQRVMWVGVAADPVPLTGDSDGGTLEAAPLDLLVYSNVA